MYGLSWDNTGDRAKGEDAVDLALLVVFLAVPLVLAAAYALCACYVRCIFDCLGDFFHSMAETHNAAKRNFQVARRRAQV